MPVRAPESYTSLGWAARKVVRNVQWTRTQGVRQLVEEHELHPIRRAVLAARKAQWRRAHPVPPAQAVPVFIVGMPRSGTNMLVRGLAVSPEFEVHNEGDRAAFHRYRLRADPDVRELIISSRHRFVLFKPLLDSHRIPTLLDGLGVPASGRALWAYRDVDGRARSALKKFGSSASNALREIAAGRGEHLWQARGLSDDSLDLIRSVDWETATPTDGVALIWYVRNRAFFELGLDRRRDVLPVSYDALVRTPEAMMQVACSFLGVAWDPRFAAHIDGRSRAQPGPLPMDPAIRARCDTLGKQLDAAAAAAMARHSPGS